MIPSQSPNQSLSTGLSKTVILSVGPFRRWAPEHHYVVEPLKWQVMRGDRPEPGADPDGHGAVLQRGRHGDPGR